jgi:hypothetical protein
MATFAATSKKPFSALNQNAGQQPAARRKPVQHALGTTVLLLAALATAGCAHHAHHDMSSGRAMGAYAHLGNGKVSSYAEFDAGGKPRAIGIVFHGGALDNLPTAHSDQHHCYDRNKDGRIDPNTECFASHERVIPLPGEVARRTDIPFKWVGLNWNPHGHIPPGVYDSPHFDVHFYIEPIEKIYAIKPGPCGPEFVNCEQFKIATRPLPPEYMPPDYKSVGAVAPAMGNHLIDVTGPEFHGKKFTRTWIYGAYDGRITFYEEMVTRDYLLSRPAACFPIKSPPAVAVKGYYPTQSCIRHHPQSNETMVSMEGFTLR